MVLQPPPISLLMMLLLMCTHIQVLEQKNTDFEERNAKMLHELERGREEFENMVEEYDKMKQEMANSDEIVEAGQVDNAQLKIQVSAVVLSGVHLVYVSL